MPYRIVLPAKTQRDLDALPAKERDRVGAAITALSGDPRPHGCMKLVNSPLWRVRIGDYRVVCAIWDREREVHIVRVARRGEHTYD